MSEKHDERDVVGTPGTEGAALGDDGQPVAGSAKTRPGEPGRGAAPGDSDDVDTAGSSTETSTGDPADGTTTSAELTPSNPDDEGSNA